MKQKIIKLITFSYLAIIIPIKSLAIDPATITMTVSVLDSIFGSKPYDPTMDLLQANRELLVETHRSLQNIESNLAKLLIDIAHLDKKIFEKNIEALEYDYGQKIIATGTTYFEELEAFKYNMQSSKNREKTKKAFIKKLNKLIYDIKSYNQRLLQGSGINGLTLSMGFLIELSMELKKTMLVDNNEIGTLKVKSKSYSRYIDATLQKVEDNKSLIYSIRRLEEQIKSSRIIQQYIHLKFTQNSDIDMKKFIGEYKIACATLRKSESYTTKCEERRCKILNIPAADFPETCHTIKVNCTKTRIVNKESKESFLPIIRENNSSLKLKSSTILDKKMSKIAKSCSTYDNTYVSYHANLKEIRKDFDLFIAKLNLLQSLYEIKQSLRYTQTILKEVEQGDYHRLRIDKSDLSTTLSDIHWSIVNIKDRENIVDTKMLIRQMEQDRKEINRLIENQNKKLKEAFKKAKESAKEGSLLSALKTAAMLYRVYSKIDTALSEQDEKNFVDSIQKTKEKLKAANSREPASVDYIYNNLDTLIDSVKFWVYLSDEKNFSEERAKIEKKIQKELEKGVSKQYDIYIFDNKLQFLLSNDDHLIPANAKLRMKNVIITGVDKY